MAYEAKSWLVAMGRTQADGTPYGQLGFTSVTRTGTGVYEYVTAEALGAGRRTLQCSIGGAPGAQLSVQALWLNDTTIEVRTFGVSVEFDVPTDSEHNLVVFALTGQA